MPPTSSYPSPVEVALRAFVADDLADLRTAFADPEIARWNPGPQENSAAEVLAWLERRNDWRDGTHASWAVAGPDGRLCGSVSLHQVDHDQADAEVGYWVAPWARRRGIGARSVDLAARFGFADLGLHRVYLFHAVENIASCRLAGSTGFRWEGQLRQSYRYADGRYHDEHLHGRLAIDPVPVLGGGPGLRG